MKKGAVQKSKQWNVKGAMRLAGVFHFLHSCGSGCLLPFLTLYLRHLGLSASMIGVIMASKHISAFVWRPLSSVLARKFDKRKMVIVGSLISSSLVILMLLLFPSTGVQAESGRCNSSQPRIHPTSPLVTFKQVPFPVEPDATVYSLEHISQNTKILVETSSEPLLTLRTEPVSTKLPLRTSTMQQLEKVMEPPAGERTEPPWENGTEPSVEKGHKPPLDNDSKPSVEKGGKGPEPSLENGTEPSVEKGTEPLLENGTEPGTEPSVEKGAEPSVEKGTEPSVEKGTEPSVEKGTEPLLENGTEPGTEPSVEKGAEPSVEKGAEPSVEKGTEPLLEKGTKLLSEKGGQGAEPSLEKGINPSPEKDEKYTELEKGSEPSLEKGGKDSESPPKKGPEPSLKKGTKSLLEKGEKSKEPPLESSTPEHSSRSSRSLKSVEDIRNEFLGSLKVMDAQHQMFFLVLIVTVLWELVASPLEWTADDGLYEYLDFVDATDRQSGVKVWKQLGAASGNIFVGILIANLFCLIGISVEFYSYTVLMILSVPAAVLFPMYLRKRTSSGGLKAVQLVYGNSQALFCAVTVVLMGMVSSAVSDFLLWQMLDVNAVEIHMGISLALAHISQISFAPMAGPLSRLLKYHGWLLVLAAVGLGMQSLYYSFLWSPWTVLPAQVLAGFSTGALWWSIALQSEEIATPGTEKSIHRLFELLSLEFGAAVGSLIAGFVVEKFGISVLFQGAAVLLALWSSVLSVLKWKLPRQRRINYSRLLAAETELSESESDQEKDWLETAMEDDGKNNNWINRF